MFALYLILTMGGATCDAVAVCDDGAASCDAVVIACDGFVGMDACLDTAAAYTPAEQVLIERPEPVYGLGCSTDLSRGWPSAVVFDRDELERAQ